MDVNDLVLIVSFFLGLGVPVVTEFVTKATAPLWLKSLVTAGVSAAVAAVAVAVGTHFDGLKEFALFFGVTWVGSMRGYFMGVGNPVAKATPTVGIGPKV